MSAKNDPSKPLPDARHEAFAVHYAVNGNAAQAWQHCTGGDGSHADANGSKWLKRGSIPARIEWLKAEAERRLQKKAEKEQAPVLLTLMRKRTILAQIAETGGKDADRISAIKADNDLAGEGSEAKAATSIVDALRAITHGRPAS